MNPDCSIPEWLARSALLIGEDDILRLMKSNVLIVGLGGVGAFAAEMIARAGVRRITVADGDVVEATNINRQLPALTSTIGRLKTDVMAERLRDISPEIELTAIPEFLRDARMAEVVGGGGFDCVLDAIDTIAPKIQMTLLCLENKIPFVSCMGSGARLNPELVRCADISKSFNCSLARVVRGRLRKLGVTTGYKVVFSPEDINKDAVVEEFSTNKRSVAGTISFIPAVFGCHCAAAVIRELLAVRKA